MYSAAIVDALQVEHQFTFDPAEHIYRLDGSIIPGVTTVLTRTGFGKAFEGINPMRLDMFLERGRWVHKVAQLWGAGDFDPTEDWAAEKIEVWQGYITAIRRVFDSGDYQPLLSEIPVCHPVYRYATIPDGVGLWRNKPAVIDWKPPNSPRAWCEAQTVAGRMALPFLQGYKYANQPHQRLAIEIGLDGNWSPKLMTYQYADRLWMNALSLYNSFNDLA